MFTRMLSRYRIVTFLLFSSVWLGLASQAVADSNRLGGISTRSYVGNSPENYMIAGVFVNGSAKKVVVRASSVDGILNPNLTIKSYPAGTVLFSNTDWVTGVSATELSQTENGKWKPAKQTDAALIVTLQPGLYTMEVAPESSPGVGIIEVYELNATAKLGGISTRSYVGTNPSDYMIAGVFVQGDPKKLIVRGSSVDGVLNPKLTIKSYPDGKVLFENTDWVSGVSASELRTLENGKWKPARESDATLIVTLNPGLYTLEVSPESSPGVGIVEVYEHPLFLGNDTAIPPTPVAQCPATASASCPVLNSPARPTTGIRAWLGAGLDSERDVLKQEACINGSKLALGGGSSKFSTTLLFDYSDVHNEITRDVGGSLSVGVFNANLDVKYNEIIEKKSLSESFVFNYEVNLGRMQLITDSTTSLNPKGIASASNGQCEFRRICGDQYVCQTEEGGRVYVKLNFNFTSDFHKREFNVTAGAGIKDWKKTICGKCGETALSISANLTTTLKNLSTTLKQNGRLEITAFQEGGNVEYLAQVIGSNVTSCTLDNTSPCFKVLDDVVKYVSGDNFAGSLRTLPTTLRYFYCPYNQVSGVPALPSDVTLAVKTTRKDILREYEKRLADKERMETLLASYNLNSIHNQQITALIQSLDGDIASLRGAGELCFDDLSNCEKNKCEVFNKLTSYNEDVFRLGLDEGMVAYYPFNGNALDKSGNGNDGISYNATLTQDRFGNPSSAYNFNGTNGYIQVAHSPQFDISKSLGFSVAFWFNSASAQRPIYSLVVYSSHFSGGIWNSGWTVQCTNDGYYGVNNFGFWFGNGSTMGNGANTTCFSDNTWHLFSATFDGRKVNVYLDGVLKGNFLFDPNSSPVANLISEALSIGSSPRGGSYFKGDMDDIRIYNRALTAAEVSQLYQMK